MFGSHLDSYSLQLAEVEKLRGEGLMLRQPKSKYVGSRSNTLLKVKSFFDDEALVVDYVPGKGKHKVGSFFFVN